MFKNANPVVWVYVASGVLLVLSIALIVAVLLGV